jgi:hypothetical protein
LDFGNTATQNINLTGIITTTTLNVGSTANILNSNLTGQTKITGGLYDRLNSIGTAGQVLTSTGTQVEWYTIPTVIPDLQQVLTAGNTAVNNIILTGNLSANNAALLTSTISTNLTLLGTLRDGLSSVGANNQVLSSNVTGVRWVNLPVYSATSPLLYNSGTGVFSIQQANASQNGYLSSADWITFDGKQTAISLTTTGNSGPSTLVGATINVPNYTLAGLGGVPLTRTLTINGVTYNLAADRSWTIVSGVSSVTATNPLFSTGGVNPDISIQQASSSLNGYLSSTDWLTFNSKEPFITAGTTLQYFRGDKTFQTLNTTVVPEGTNLYYLDSRARAAVSLTTIGSSGASTYNSTTGVFNIPDYGSALSGYVPTSRTLNINGISYDLSADRSWSVGTVTSVAALTLGTTGTDLSSSVATGTTTPVITLNVPTASAVNRGALSAADWSTFNTKVGGVTATSPLFSSGGSTPNITIQQSSGSQDGYLSSTDWSTFNNKQTAGNYITSLTGEATASGPGAAAVTLDNASVTGKVLTGVNITGGTVLATDTMLTAFGKLQNQVNGLIGGSIYQGTWNASTNTPTLTSSVGTQGYYYIVSVAGTTNLDGITDWFVGDWAIFNGGVWQQVDNTDAVVSVNGQTGAVSLTTDNIPEGVTNLYYTDTRARAALSFVAGSGAYNSTTGVITIPTNTSQLTNGANFITLASLSGTAPISYNSGTGAISITQSGAASNGYLSSTDWNTFNNKQNALTNPVLASGSWTSNYIPKINGTYTLTNSLLYDGGSSIGVNTNAPHDSSQFKLDVNGGLLIKNTSGTIAQLILINSDPAAGGNNGFVQFIAGGNTSTAFAELQTYYGLAIASGALRLQPTAGQVLVGTTTTSAFMVDINGTLRATGQLTLGSTITNGTYTYTLPSADGTLALVGGSGVGTVTSVAALTLGTTGTDLSSTVANSTTTPVITLNVPTASATNRGALSSADWSTFNNKQATITLTTTGSSGAATLVGATLNIPNYGSALSGYVTLDTGQTITGAKIFTANNLFTTYPNRFTEGVGIKETAGYGSTSGYTTISGAVNGLSLYLSNGGIKTFLFSSSTSNNTFTFPDATGTIALTSNLSSYLPLSGGTLTGLLNGTSADFSSSVSALELLLDSAGTASATFVKNTNGIGVISSGSNQIGFNLNNAFFITSDNKGCSIFSFNHSSSSYTYTLPSANGTIALTSDLSSYVPTSRTLTINGTTYDLSANRSWSITAGVSSVTASSPLFSSGGSTPNITIQQSSGSQDGYLSSADWSTFNNKASTASLANYLLLTGGTLTGQLYINPTNTATVGLDVASNTTRFRSDNLEGFKRQLEITMGSGTLVQMVAKGFGANYITDMAFYSSTSGGVNAIPAIYITGTNNRVGIKTGSPAYDLDVSGTGRFTGQLIANSTSFPLDVYGTTNNYGLRINNVQAATLFLYSSNANAASRNWGLFTNSEVYGDFDIRQSNAINGDLTNGANSTSRFYIKNNGNVGIGTSSAGAILRPLNIKPATDIPQLYLVQSNNDAGGWMQRAGLDGHYHLISYQGTESEKLQVRYDTGSVLIGNTSLLGASGGTNLEITGGRAQLLVNSTTSIASWFTVYPAGDGNAYIIRNTGYSFLFGTATSQNTSGFTQQMAISSSGVVTINNIGSGAVTATSGVLSATSDMNLKISDGYIDTALDKILKLTPRYFYWKEETGLPTDLRQLGFYAQEVNEAIGEEGANTPKGENDKWGIYDRAIIAMLTKAMQEQNEVIEDLKARLIKLENQ